VSTNKKAAVIKFGKMAAPEDILRSDNEPVVDKVTVIRIPYVQYKCPAVLCALGRNYENKSGGEFNTSRANAKRYDGTSGTKPAFWVYLNPVSVTVGELDEALNYKAPASQNLPRIVEEWTDGYPNPKNLESTPINLNLDLSVGMHCDLSIVGALTNTTCALLQSTNGLLNSTINSLEVLLDGVLESLEPSVDTLFTQLGANLNDVKVGAKQTCSTSGATLVN